MSKDSNRSGPLLQELTEASDPFGLHKFSLRRYSVQQVLLIIAINGILITLTVRAATSGNTAFLVISSIGTALMLALTALVLYVGSRLVSTEIWIRRLGMGDLEYRIDAKGKDEISMSCQALETLRQSSIRAMRLDLVQKLSDELQEKNGELAETLDELRRTQDQIISQEKLAELGDLSAGVAHEIRNPLQFVKNFAESSENISGQLAEILEQDWETLDKDEREEALELAGDITWNMERIIHHSDQANRIVSDMLEMRKDKERDFTRTELNRLLTDEAKLAYEAVLAQDPQFKVDISRETDPEADEIEAVPEDLGRVFINLVNNSLHSMQDRAAQDSDYTPRLWLITKRVGDEVEVRIRDNGGGMAPEVMGKIFNPFFTTREAGEGTGLGLSLTRDIVRRHGGTIVPESEPGEYAEMILTLPANHVRTHESATASAPSAEKRLISS